MIKIYQMKISIETYKIVQENTAIDPITILRVVSMIQYISY